MEEDMSATDLSATLSRLSGTASRLNEASNSVNKILTDVEHRLIQANVGLEVWLDQAISSSDPWRVSGEKRWKSQFLGFAKVNGAWCLALKPVEFSTGFFEGDESCPYEE